MAQNNYDIIVIGGGPGGYTSAIRASQLGFRTAIIEKERLGGICLNWGCIPTKALLKNAETFRLLQSAEEWGITYENLRLDFSRVIKRSRGIADKISKGVEFLMKKHKIDHITGHARLSDIGKVEVESGEKKLKINSAHIIIATGARPRSLPEIAIDRKQLITSAEAMNLPQQPESMVIVGAGAIGVEFAYFYNAIGTRVTLVEMLPTILPAEDKEIARMMESSLKKQGISILTGSTVTNISRSPEGVTVRVETPHKGTDLAATVALIAIGVRGNIEDLGLGQLGVTTEKDHIRVDEHYRTSTAGVYAIGDVIGPPWLAHVASAEGIHCVETIAGKNPEPLDYHSVPGCTYCQPQVASVGLTEDQALEAGYELRIGKCPFRPLGKAMAIGETEGMVKLIFDAKYGELLGAHLMGSEATEMIAELVVAKRLEATGRELAKAVHAHPTLGEAVMEAAAAAYGEAINI